MSKVHDYYDSLQEEEKERLNRNSNSQEAIVWALMKRNPDYPFAYFEIKERFDWDKDSTKRSLSNLSGSGPDRYKDDWGRWPVVYDPEERKKNPKSNTTCGTYKLNRDYGKKPEPQPVGPNEQLDAFGSPEIKNRNGIVL